MNREKDLLHHSSLSCVAMACLLQKVQSDFSERVSLPGLVTGDDSELLPIAYAHTTAAEVIIEAQVKLLAERIILCNSSSYMFPLVIESYSPHLKAAMLLVNPMISINTDFEGKQTLMTCKTKKRRETFEMGLSLLEN